MQLGLHHVPLLRDASGSRSISGLGTCLRSRHLDGLVKSWLICRALSCDETNYVFEIEFLLQRTEGRREIWAKSMRPGTSAFDSI